MNLEIMNNRFILYLIRKVDTLMADKSIWRKEFKVMKKRVLGKRALTLILVLCMIVTTVTPAASGAVYAESSSSSTGTSYTTSTDGNENIQKTEESSSTPLSTGGETDTSNIGQGQGATSTPEPSSGSESSSTSTPESVPSGSTEGTEGESSSVPGEVSDESSSTSTEDDSSSSGSSQPDSETEDEDDSTPEEEDDSSVSDDTTVEEEFVPVAVLDPENGDTVIAEVGEEVVLSAGINRDDVLVEYQWQRMQLEMPKEDPVEVAAIHEYPEMAPTWYSFAIDNVTEAQALEKNPDMTWPGIELYYAAVDALNAIGADSSNVSFAWRTSNYALDGFTIRAENTEVGVRLYAEKGEQRYVAALNDAGEFEFSENIVVEETPNNIWLDIENATEPSYTFTVAKEDFYAQYRLKVTIVDEEYLAKCIEILTEQGIELTEEQKSEEQVVYSVMMQVKSGIMDTGSAAPIEPKSGINTMMSAFQSTSAPYLSDDGQWICGLNGNYEYVTEDTYNRIIQWKNEGKISSTQYSYYWTWLNPKGWKGYTYANVLDENGFPTGETRLYSGFNLTDGKLEVASEWYGKTVLFRVAGTNSITKIKIPAYTELFGDGDKYNEAASGSKYKKAITFLNPYTLDTGSMYKSFLDYTSVDGWISEMLPDGTVTSNTTDNHVEVYTVDAESFNADPQRYMVDAEGNYRMDSVGWGVCTYQEPDISGKAYWVLKDYISDGYGFLAGHDTMYAYAGAYYDAFGVELDESSIDPNDGTTWYYDINSWNPGTTAHDPNGNKSTTRGGHFYMNQLMGSNKGNVYSGSVAPTDAASLILSTGGSHGKYGKLAMYGSTQLGVRELGYPAETAKANPRYRTPTNYPYVFGKGQTLNASLTHTNGQAAFGTIWVDYIGNAGASLWGGYADPLYWTIDGKTGTNNFYLTGNGNFLMNEIGHLPTNGASNYESILFSNSVMYVSQRKQCEVCAANQNGQQTSHFVRRVSGANANEVLTALSNGGSYWYPIDGCYMLTEDITLPEDWTPIKNFNGHWNSDVYEVYLNSKGTPLLANDTADGEAGWNLGTDKTKGTEYVFNAGMTRTTGVARVVGDLNDLFETSTNYAGYTVKILGTDNPKYMDADEAYTCEVNADSKYVISNLPCLYKGAEGILIARVYTPAGAEVTEYGTITASIPEEFWDTDETVPLDLLDLNVLPPVDRTIWVSQEADFTATVLTSGYEYSEAKITWQYKAPGGKWTALNADQTDGGGFVHKSDPVEKDGYLVHDFLGTDKKLAGQPFQYEIVHLGYVDTGDITTTGTQTRLHIFNAPTGLSGYQFRIAYEGNKGQLRYSNVDAETGKESPGAKLTVKPPQIKATMSNEQHLFIQYQTLTGQRTDYTVPGDQWPSLYGKTYNRTTNSEGVPYNNGNNIAVYTSEVLYLPHLTDSNVPDITWRYRDSNLSTTEIPFVTSTFDEATKTWDVSFNANFTDWKLKYPQLKISVQNTMPVAVDENGNPNPNGEWRKIVTTMTLDGASSQMDFGDIHHFFRTETSGTFGVGDSEITKKATSPDADLYIEYDIDIVPNQGQATNANGYATWTFPELEVYAPNGARTGAITFYEPGHSVSNKINVQAGNPYGISIAVQTNDYVLFKSENGNLIPEKDWQAFFRNYLSFVTYDQKDDKLKDLSWYIAEDDESTKFRVDIFDGTTDGWTGNGEKFGPRGNYGWGGPSTWGGGANSYNNTISYKGLSVTNNQIAATETSSSQWIPPTWDGSNYYHFRGYQLDLSKTFDSTNLSKLYLNAEISHASSNGLTNSIQLIHQNGTLNIFAPAGGRTHATTNGLKEYDLSAMTGPVTLNLHSEAATNYALTGSRNKDSQYVGVTEATKAIVYTAYALSTDFERTSKSAIRFSEIWAGESKESANVTLVADPEKIYDGYESRAYLTVNSPDNDFVIENATITYYLVNDDGSRTVVSQGADVDMNSICLHQGTYVAVVTFNDSVINRFAMSGLDAGSKDSVSATFKINPRPVYLHSLYQDPADPVNNPRNIKGYDGTNTATITNIIVDNVVSGDELTVAPIDYKGTYATANAGEQLGPDGKPQADRFNKLTENVIVRNADSPIILENNDYGDYYIASENYSGAIYRELLDVRVKPFRYMYGSASAPGVPTFEPEYQSDTVTDTWMSVSGLVSQDVLRLDGKFKLESLGKDGAPITFTDRTPVGEYTVEPKGLTETNYPVLKNYLVYISEGLVSVYPREIVITAADTDWYAPAHGIPQTYAIFDLMNDDEETYTAIGNDAENAYSDLHLIGDDTVANTITVGGNAITKDVNASIKELGADDTLHSIFNNGSNIPYATTWYDGAPAKYLPIESDATIHRCEWCESYHGFELGTEHWRVDGYSLKVNQNPDEGDTLEVVPVENLLGEQVQNYTIRYVDGLLYVHPKLRFQLEATVPLQVCMYGYAGDGEVVEPENYGITNYSNGAIRITDIDVSMDGWSIVNKVPADLLRGEMTMKLADTQVVGGHNKPVNWNRWVIPADQSDDKSGNEMLIPMTCYIAGGNVNAQQESYVAKVTYTIAEHGITVPNVEGMDIPDTIQGQPVTVDDRAQPQG